MNWYRFVDRSAVQFDFVVNRRSVPYAHAGEIRALGGRIFYVDRPSWRLWRYVGQWVRLISQHSEWRIVHGHYTSAALAYLTIARLYGRATIAHSHSAERRTRKSLAKRATMWPLRWLAHYRMACSPQAAAWAFPHAATEIVPNAIDVQRITFAGDARRSVRAELGIGDEVVIGHVGRFDSAKNQQFLLDVFAEVARSRNDVVLLLVGDGPLRSELELSARSQGVQDRVIFTGARADVPSLLSAMDAFVFPSKHEGFGIAALESQASGLPTILSDAVPRAVAVSDLAEFLPLGRGPIPWVEKLTTLKRVDLRGRLRYGQAMAGGAYDAVVAADKLRARYKVVLEETT